MSTLRNNTIVVQDICDPDNHWGSSISPIFQTASFEYPTAEKIEDVFSGKEFGYIYSRINNPTVAAFEHKINNLENGTGAIAFSSGMAAISTVIGTLTKAGDNIIASKSLFGGTLSLLDNFFNKFGVTTTYIDCTDTQTLKAVITDRTKAIFIETLGNPKLDIPDIKGIARISGEYGIPLIADATLTPPIMFRGKDHGISILIHSATKYITGNGSTIGGVCIDTGNFDWERIKEAAFSNLPMRIHKKYFFLAAARKFIHQNLGGCLSPFNAYLHLLGIHTLGLRIERICDNALALARSLSNHPGIKEIGYPGLPGNPFYHRAKELFSTGFGGMISIKLGSREQCFALINRLKVVKNLANLGDVKTLIIHPHSTIYADVSPPSIKNAGVTVDLLRISVGIEDINDLIEDFADALEGV